MGLLVLLEANRKWAYVEGATSGYSEDGNHRDADEHRCPSINIRVVRASTHHSIRPPPRVGSSVVSELTRHGEAFR